MLKYKRNVTIPQEEATCVSCNYVISERGKLEEAKLFVTDVDVVCGSHPAPCFSLVARHFPACLDCSIQVHRQPRMVLSHRRTL